MKYVIIENDVIVKLVSVKGFVPKSSMRAPESARDISEIIIVDVDDLEGGFKKVAQLDPAKVAEYDAEIIQKELDQDDAELAKKRKKDKIKGLNASDLKNDADVKQAIIDILDYLGLN